MTNTQLIVIWAINILSALVAVWAMHQKSKFAAILLEICQASDAAIDTLTKNRNQVDNNRATSVHLRILANWHKVRVKADKMLPKISKVSL